MDYSKEKNLTIEPLAETHESDMIFAMEFVHRPYEKEETIAAVATPPGEGGIAVIRISGGGAIDLVEKIYTGPVRTYPSHTVHFGKILGNDQKVIDEVLLIVMRAPRSYTGEDVIEIHCHGGSLITRRVLERVLESGARAAQPGEFTFKAFLNGRIDLAQAEAVQALISARSDLALSAAKEQLQGSFSEEVRSFQKELVDIAAILEAWVDFPEEGLEFASIDQVIASLEKCVAKMEKRIKTFEDGKKISEGITICLAGCPNVGKSSLMNALLGKERAIVTEVPGTTRDLLEDGMKLGTLHVWLTDTAGIRKTDEIVEKEGIRRSRQAIDVADLVLFILDASRKITPDDQQLIDEIPKDKTIFVWNKMDLVPEGFPLPFAFQPQVAVSAKNRMGLEELKMAIDQLVWKNGPPSKEEIVITHLRHYQALEAAIVAGHAVIEGLKNGVSPEFMSIDMRKMLFELGTIIGVNISEDILSAIFAKFCVGK